LKISDILSDMISATQSFHIVRIINNYPTKLIKHDIECLWYSYIDDNEYGKDQ